MNAIFHRTSIRKFTEQAVEPEKLEQLLKAAMAAPSACNQQPWSFVVVRSEKVRNQLVDCSRAAGPCRNAPVVIVPCYTDEVRVPEFAVQDTAACVENLLLQADDLGLGAVWMGIAPREDRMRAVAEVLELPEHVHCFAFIAVGYPAEGHAQEDRFHADRIRYID